MKFRIFRKIVYVLDYELVIICYYFYKLWLYRVKIKQMEKMMYYPPIIDDGIMAKYFNGDINRFIHEVIPTGNKLLLDPLIGILRVGDSNEHQIKPLCIVYIPYMKHYIVVSLASSGVPNGYIPQDYQFSLNFTTSGDYQNEIDCDAITYPETDTDNYNAMFYDPIMFTLKYLCRKYSNHSISWLTRNSL